jgi:hypothetical protein
MNATPEVLLSVCLGLMAGRLCAEEIHRRKRKNAKVNVEDRHLHLEQAAPQAPTSERQLREIRKVLNDAHKHILAVSKALKIPAR